MIQYAAPVLIIREFTAYWMPAFAGMTAKRVICFQYYAEAAWFALASIWPIASTTASKVSIVEAWRAL
jgi:hypothetical protein